MSTHGQMSPLSEDQLNPTDKAILTELRKGRCTPAYIAEKHEYSSGNVRNRMIRLSEHQHVNALGGGLYELIDDPVGELSGREIDLETIKSDIRRALETREWAAVEDAAARLGVDDD